MDSIQCLVGLFDELNLVELDRIKTRNDLVEKSSELGEIVETLENCDIQNLRKPYNRNGDTQIRPRFYLRVMRKADKRQYYNDSSKRTNNNIENIDGRW